MPSSCRSRTARAVPGTTLRFTQTKARFFWSWASSSLRPAASRPRARARAVAVRAGIAHVLGHRVDALRVHGDGEGRGRSRSRMEPRRGSRLIVRSLWRALWRWKNGRSEDLEVEQAHHDDEGPERDPEGQEHEAQAHHAVAGRGGARLRGPERRAAHARGRALPSSVSFGRPGSAAGPVATRGRGGGGRRHLHHDGALGGGGCEAEVPRGDGLHPAQVLEGGLLEAQLPVLLEQPLLLPRELLGFPARLRGAGGGARRRATPPSTSTAPSRMQPPQVAARARVDLADHLRVVDGLAEQGGRSSFTRPRRCEGAQTCAARPGVLAGLRLARPHRLPGEKGEAFRGRQARGTSA